VKFLNRLRGWPVFIVISSCSLATPKIISETISSQSIELSAHQKGYLSKPKEENRAKYPAIVLMHGCAGLETSVLEGLLSHSQFFNGKGYVTFIVDSFSLRGKGAGLVCNSISELAQARVYRQEDARVALTFLKSQKYVDSDHIFLIGQSNGGSVALEVAVSSRRGEFKAVAAYYPWCGVLAQKINTPLLILGGENDSWVSPKSCKLKEKKVEGAEIKVIIYPGAEHSFDLDIEKQKYSGHWVGGDSSAKVESRKEILNWFERFKDETLKK
jgi:dienelactone hydrolase